MVDIGGMPRVPSQLSMHNIVSPSKGKLMLSLKLPAERHPPSIPSSAIRSCWNNDSKWQVLQGEESVPQQCRTRRQAPTTAGSWIPGKGQTRPCNSTDDMHTHKLCAGAHDSAGLLQPCAIAMAGLVHGSVIEVDQGTPIAVFTEFGIPG